MKKLFKSSFLLMIMSFAAFTMNSCEKPVDPNTKIPEGAIVMERAEVLYTNPMSENGADVVLVALMSKEYVNGKVGEILDIMLLASASETAKLTPGTYPIEEFDDLTNVGTAVEGVTLPFGPLGTNLYILPVEKAEDVINIPSGEIKITEVDGKFTIQANVKVNGEDRIYYFSGEIILEDGRRNN